MKKCGFMAEEFSVHEEMRVHGVFLSSIPVCPHGVQEKTSIGLNLMIKMQHPSTTIAPDSK
jgi:hypothetical protein